MPPKNRDLFTVIFITCRHKFISAQNLNRHLRKHFLCSHKSYFLFDLLPLQVGINSKMKVMGVH